MTTPKRLRYLAHGTNSAMLVAAGDMEKMQRDIDDFFKIADRLKKNFQEAMARLDKEMAENVRLRTALMTLHESAEGMTPNELRAFVDGTLDQDKVGTSADEQDTNTR